MNKKEALIIVQEDGWELESLPAHFKKDKEIVLEAINEDGYVLEFADESLRKEREFILKIVKQNGLTLFSANDSLKKDKEVVLEAVKQNGNALESADDSLKKDKEVVLEAVKQRGETLQFADKSLRKNREVVLEAVKKDGFALRFADKILKKDKEIVLVAVKVHASILSYADINLRKDPDILSLLNKVCANCKHSCHCIAINKKSIRCQEKLCSCSECDCSKENLITDKNLALIAIKENRYQIEKVDKKLYGDQDIIKLALNSKDPSKWATDPVMEFIGKSKIKDKKFIKYILSKAGLTIDWIDNKFKKNKELAMIAVKQNGHAINFLDKSLQKDKIFISLAIKTGRTDLYHGKKLKLHLPQISFYLNLSNKSKSGPGYVEGLEIWNTYSYKKYYFGETLNGIPHGKGYAESYETSAVIKKVYKTVSKKWRNNYSKHFAKIMEHHVLLEKYIGEWKFGMYEGEGEFIEYAGPEYFTNKDDTPKISEKYIGNFKQGEKKGKFKVYHFSGDENDGEQENKNNWSLKTFK